MFLKLDDISRLYNKDNHIMNVTKLNKNVFDKLARELTEISNLYSGNPEFIFKTNDTSFKHQIKQYLTKLYVISVHLDKNKRLLERFNTILRVLGESKISYNLSNNIESDSSDSSSSDSSEE